MNRRPIGTCGGEVATPLVLFLERCPDFLSTRAAEQRLDRSEHAVFGIEPKLFARRPVGEEHSTGWLDHHDHFV